MVFRITLIQGLNRQIRRMCEFVGYQVRTLERVRIMHVALGKQWLALFAPSYTEQEKKLFLLSKNRKKNEIQFHCNLTTIYNYLFSKR